MTLSSISRFSVVKADAKNTICRFPSHSGKTTTYLSDRLPVLTNDRFTLTFGARNKATTRLKEAVGLTDMATEEEFQRARKAILATEGWPSTKAQLTKDWGLPNNATEKELRQLLESTLAKMKLNQSKEEIELFCDLLMAYPPPHPFEYEGRSLS